MHSPEPRSLSRIPESGRPGRSTSSRRRPAVQVARSVPTDLPLGPWSLPGTHTATEGPSPQNAGVGRERQAPGPRRRADRTGLRAGAARGRVGMAAAGLPRGAGERRPSACTARAVRSVRRAGLAAPPPPEVPGRDRTAPASRRQEGRRGDGVRGRGFVEASIKGLKRNLHSSLLRYVTCRNGSRLSPLLPTPFVSGVAPPPLNFPPQGMGLPAAGRDST